MFVSQQPKGIVTITPPTLQPKNMRNREVEWFF